MYNPTPIKHYKIEHFQTKTTNVMYTSTTTKTTTSTPKSTTTNKFLAVFSKALKRIQPKQDSQKSITYIELPEIVDKTTTKANDIFILEPDDYSDIISQFISSNSSDYYYGEKDSISYFEKLTPSSGAITFECFQLNGLFKFPIFYLILSRYI